jgi:light-regulated signal transduction histidine kinase (bacteriophytochrome)
MNHSTQPDGRHAVPDGFETNPAQLCHDTTQDTIPCTSEVIQGSGILFVLQLTGEPGNLPVQAVSDNSQRLVGRTPSELLSLESFTSIIKETQVDEFVEQIDLVQSQETDTVANRFEAFTISMSTSTDQFRDFWCVMHQTDNHSASVICEFELHENERAAERRDRPLLSSPSNTISGTAPSENFAQGAQSHKRPLVGRRISGKRKCSSVAMDTLNTLSRVQDRLAIAPDVESLLKVSVETIKDLTGFHRVMVYQFDQNYNARVVTEHTDTRAAAGTFLGRTFAAPEFTSEPKDSHRLNKLRMLYDRDTDSAQLVCSASRAFQHPLDLTYSYLRAASHDHHKFLVDLAVRSYISISIRAFGRPWGLITCHSYGLRGTRVSFPTRRVCHLLSDVVSGHIERLSYVSRLQAGNLVNTIPTSQRSPGCLGPSLEPLLKPLGADFGILSVRNTTLIFGPLEQPQDALAMLAYLRLKTVTSVLTSTNITTDFVDLRCPFRLRSLGGILAVPLLGETNDFIVFFRKSHTQELEQTGKSDYAPIEKTMRPPELRKNSEAPDRTAVECQNWTQGEVEIASVFAFLYAKFIAIWGHNKAVLQSSRLIQLLLENTAHEIRTPLNAVINYLELALEGSLDKRAREKAEESQRASQSLLPFVHQLLKLVTKNRISF